MISILLHYLVNGHCLVFDALSKTKIVWILMKQKMKGWQWHQLEHMQVLCSLIQSDNHASSSSLKILYRPDALPDAQPTVSKD